jgi:predicted DNA binding CopG/RHH family protein
MARTKKPGTAEAWERGELGETLESAKVVSQAREAEIEEAAGLQMISIRLPKSVIEDFKAIARIEGVGYQPLMRTALIRFAECEAKRVVREYAAHIMEKRVSTESPHRPPRKPSRGHDPRLEKKVA